MFKKAVFFTTLCFSILCTAWLYKLIYISSADKEEFEKIKTKGKALAQVTQDQETHQHRAGVRKDLWLSQEDKSRLHYRIGSKSSVLTLVPIDDKVDIIENLEQIQCWMQDKVYTQGNAPMQQMRFFEADRGLYQYSTQKFAASSVVLSLFRLPGSQLPFSIDPRAAFLRGIAQDVSFSIAGKATQFQAQRFKATLVSQQGTTP